jgi:ferric-dicitrate binding protein FerR (iron transport regulator)
MKSSFKDLVEKYLSGCITAKEQQQLLDMMKKKENQAVLNRMIDAAMKQEMISDPENSHLIDSSFQMLEDKINRLQPEPAVKRTNRRYVYMAAATLILVIGCVCFYWLFNKPPASITHVPVPNNMYATTYTRHIVLPDSSIVLLRANSTIQLLSGFGTGKREIVLSGEAYFDVRHDAARPFIVHTGQVKTTVLGTAFNIKAWPGIKQVIVAVTRGKVRVEDNNKTVATLTHDSQVTYSLKDESASQQSVNANMVVSNWTKKDVVFESISFKEMATILSKRYNVSIQFANEALTHCHVRTSFKGTESLNEMLDLLCIAMNATYTMNGNDEVVINGEGCK